MILYDHRIAHQKIQNFHEIIEVIEIYSMNSGVPPTESMKSSRRRVTSTIKTRCPGSTGWNKSAGNNGFQLFLLVYFGFSCKKSIVYICIYICIYYNMYTHLAIYISIYLSIYLYVYIYPSGADVRPKFHLGFSHVVGFLGFIQDCFRVY